MLVFVLHDFVYDAILTGLFSSYVPENAHDTRFLTDLEGCVGTRGSGGGPNGLRYVSGCMPIRASSTTHCSFTTAIAEHSPIEVIVMRVVDTDRFGLSWTKWKSHLL